MRMKELKEKFDDLYNYVEEYKTIRPVMEADIERLKGDVDALKMTLQRIEKDKDTE